MFKKIFFMLVIGIMLIYDLNAQHWTQTNGPYGGVIARLCAVKQHYFAATEAGGLFVSTDAGDSWSNVGPFRGIPGPGIFSNSINSLLVSDTLLYVGSIGITMSNDLGKTWENIGPNFQVSSMAKRGDTLLAGTPTYGLYRSTNNGSTWSSSNLGATVQAVWSISCAGNLIAIGTTSGVFISHDTGETWSRANGGLGNSSVNSVYFKGTTLFAANLFGVHRSDDFGTNWISLRNGMPNNMEIHEITGDGQNIYTSVSCMGVYRSSDNGDSWTQLQTGLENSCVLSILIDNDLILAGTNGAGVYSSNHGDTWIEKNNGLQGTSVISITAKGDTILAGTRADGLLHSSDKGNSWASFNFGNALPGPYNNTWFPAVITHNNTIVAGSWLGAVRSNNNGSTWEGIYSSVFNSLLFEQNILWAGLSNQGVIKSTDNGDHWTSTGLNNTDVNRLLYSESNIFAATPTGIYASKDNGVSWAISGIANTYVFSLAKIGRKLIAGTASGIYVSNSPEIHWVPQGLSDLPIQDLVVKGSNVYAASASYGVFFSTDSASSWSPLGDFVGPAFSLCASGDKLFAGTYGNGIWETTICNSPQQPKISVISSSDKYILLHSSSKIGNQWFLNGILIPGATDSIYNSNTHGKYSVQANSGLCRSEMSIAYNYEYPDPKIEMPNVFTPNGDRCNPVFEPMIYDYIKSGTLHIINRWGQEVFNTMNPQEGWDGGKTDPGVYYYLLRYVGYNGKSGTLNGWVQIIR